MQAYDLGLVKQIEVDGVLADEDHNQAFVELVGIEARPASVKVKVIIDVNGKTGPKRSGVDPEAGR